MMTATRAAHPTVANGFRIEPRSAREAINILVAARKSIDDLFPRANVLICRMRFHIGSKMEPELVGRHCPKCRTREQDLRVRACSSCGETLSDLLRAEGCPKCGIVARGSAFCISCGTELVIGLPLEDTYPEKPFEEPLRPVILIRSAAPRPGESTLPRASMGGEETQMTAARLASINFSTSPDQMSGVSKDHLRLSVGEVVTLFIRGEDPEGKWFQLPMGLETKWEADKELDIRPDQWDTVSVKLLEPPKVNAMATVRATNPAGQKIERILTVQRR